MPAPSAARAHTLLIVEDESLLRMMAVDIFEDAGFTVFEAASGADGARILAAHPEIDGLFTDVEMPGPVSGLDLARIAHESHPHVAILVVSGRATPSQDELPPGAKFVGKPYDNQAIVGLFDGLKLKVPSPV